MLSLEQKRVLRTRIMQWLYEITNGNELAMANPRSSELATNYDLEDVQSAIKFLEGEYLLEPHWTIGPSLPHMQISHLGVLEVEQGLMNADTETEHFVPFNSVNLTYVQGDLNTTQFQQGVSNSTQTLSITSEDSESAKALIRAIKENLDALGISEDSRTDLNSDLAVVENELLKPRPRKAILRSCFETIRQIIMTTSTDLAVQQILVMHWPHF